jgi:hypothetical protein
MYIGTTISTAVSRNLVAFGFEEKLLTGCFHEEAFGGIRYGRGPNLPDSRVLSALGRRYSASISATDARLSDFRAKRAESTVQARVRFQSDRVVNHYVTDHCL